MKGLLSIFHRMGKGSDFEILLAPHVHSLFHQAYQYTGSYTEAEDLLQELFLQLYSQREKLATIEHLHAWLLKCLYNRFIDNYRKQQHSPKTSSVDDIDSYCHTDAKTNLEALQIRKEIHQALSLLTPDQRAIVCLHDIDGYRLSELAEILDQPLGTLKSHLHRGRVILKKALGLQPFDGTIRYKS